MHNLYLQKEHILFKKISFKYSLMSRSAWHMPDFSDDSTSVNYAIFCHGRIFIQAQITYNIKEILKGIII